MGKGSICCGSCKSLAEACPPGRGACAAGGHFVEWDRFAWLSRCSSQASFASPSERHTKSNTHHEVVAARVGRISSSEIGTIRVRLDPKPRFTQRSSCIARLMKCRQEESTMGGAQIERFLTLIEPKAAFNPAQARREVLEYINTRMSDVAGELERRGEAIIPTSNGSFLLTREDLQRA
jgi:hypothetical protein